MCLLNKSVNDFLIKNRVFPYIRIQKGYQTMFHRKLKQNIRIVLLGKNLNG